MNVQISYPNTYYCRTCGLSKPSSEFYPYCPYNCKKCKISKSTEWRKKNPERYRFLDKKRRSSIKSKAVRRLYIMTNQDKLRRYYIEWYKKNGRQVNEKDIMRMRQWNKKNKAKADTHRQVKHALSLGMVVKPDACEICGRDTRLVAHHEDYSKPLDVIWLCGSCHNRIHKSLQIKPLISTS